MAKTEKEKTGSDLALKIGVRLRSLREKRGETLEAFANRHNMTMGQLGRYERGESNMQVDTLERILIIYGISVKEFFSEGF